MSRSIILTATFGLITLGISLGVMFAALERSHAQTAGPAVESGRALVGGWCAECHRTESGQPGRFAADFDAVANLPSTTALSLRVFLQSNHQEMPNFILTPAQADEIIAYILSLKRH